MQTRIALAPGADLPGFRAAVRGLVARGVKPREVLWETGASLFGAAPPQDGPAFSLPRAAAELIGLVICHRDPARHALLYEMIWRLRHGEPHLLEMRHDKLTHRLEMLAKAVRRDLHKMHAFVRFRRVEDAQGERFLAWFEPDHHILEATSGFFVNRFRSLVWSILTPEGTLHWDGTRLEIGPPGQRGDVPERDEVESGWLDYYQSIFNPARLNTAMMQKEMPRKYWRNLPEARLIPELVAQAPARVEEMIARAAAMSAKRDPQKAVAAMAAQTPTTLAALNRIITASPPFLAGSTRAVLGEGVMQPAIAFIGEQPGDEEDAQGRCFVGPAGQLLDAMLARAGIDRAECYITNAVKHFKFEQRGKNRLHQSPTTGEIKHYRWWLLKELELVRPRLVVALGASAALAVGGQPVCVTQARGPAQLGDWPAFVTTHPSYLLRLPDEQARRAAEAAFLQDLRAVRRLAQTHA
ncbi:UdgX family uracil-DNA binding protein [Acidocella facilis]|uniref:UdgX family uracil-DNA binding protein n=1 Tax=Acidocella facilis TaxID=525 RepID=UPI00047BDF31|nr:UdgX family uracil-DNA binding protein [Acidocella facilis]